jgi:hypothetical protein
MSKASAPGLGISEMKELNQINTTVPSTRKHHDAFSNGGSSIQTADVRSGMNISTSMGVMVMNDQQTLDPDNEAQTLQFRKGKDKMSSMSEIKDF